MIRLIREAVAVVKSVFEWRNPPMVGEYVSAYDSQFDSVEAARRWTRAEWAEELGCDFWSEAS